VQTTNPVGQRRTNLAVLARAIWNHPGISRRQLVESFDIDESSVSRLVGLLIDMGLVETMGTVEGSTAAGPAPGGRKRVALQIRPGFGQAWGLTLWRDRVLVTLVDVQGRSLATGEFPATFQGNWRAYLDQALGFASTLARQNHADLPVLGLGFAVPGWIDSETSTVVQSDEFGLVQERCPTIVDEAFPVLWENDANCGAWCGLGQQPTAVDEVFVLGRFLDHGPMGLPSELSVGFGLIIDGKLHRGWRHHAGEFQSALWKPGFTSGFGVDDATFGHSRHDPEAFQRTVTDLVRNLRFVSQFLDPKVVRLGGDLKRRTEGLRRACDDLGWAAGRELLTPLPDSQDEVSLGAARLVLEELFQSPSAQGANLFRGYGTGVHDPLWRGLSAERFRNPLG